jgi:transcriptional regulator with XRE-family HTH domain
MLLIEPLVAIRQKLGMTLKQMAAFLSIPSSTYNAYEKGKISPKIEFYELYEARLGIALRRSVKTAIICYTDNGKRMRALQKQFAQPHKIAVYFNHSIQDLVYNKQQQTPAFSITYPDNNLHSFCIGTNAGFAICRPITRTRISKKKQLLLLVMEANGMEETGYFQREDGFVLIKGRKIAIKDIYRAFIISNILTGAELTEHIA